MSMLNIANRLAEAQEAQIVPAGEYELELVGGKVGTDKNNLEYVGYLFRITEGIPETVVNPKLISQFFWIDSAERVAEIHGKQRANDNDLNLRRMYDALQFDYSQEFHVIDGPKGCRAWAMLKTATDDYGDKNTISRWTNTPV